MLTTIASYAARAGCATLVLIGLIALPGAAAAQPNPDAQLWVQALAVGQLSDTWRSHVEVQPRWMDDASELGLTIVRSALGYQVSPRVSVWLGYAWVPRTLGEGLRHEQRVWQQVSLAGPRPGGWATSARVRVEQRWLTPWQDTSHRLRLMGRTQRPIGGGGRWGVYAYDEAMITMDRTSAGPARGYDRNRLSAGLTRRVSRAVSMDGGYLWENSTLPGGAGRNDHIAIGVLNLALPRR